MSIIKKLLAKQQEESERKAKEKSRNSKKNAR